MESRVPTFSKFLVRYNAISNARGSERRNWTDSFTGASVFPREEFVEKEMRERGREWEPGHINSSDKSARGRFARIVETWKKSEFPFIPAGRRISASCESARIDTVTGSPEVAI